MCARTLRGTLRHVRGIRGVALADDLWVVLVGTLRVEVDHIKGREGGALARWTVFALASTAIVISVAAIVVSVAAIDERKLRDLGALALLLRLLVGVGLAGALTLAVDLGAQA